MPNYSLSKAAEKDFENIFNYGIDQFGLAQAITYQTGLKNRFMAISKNPFLYNAVPHIKKDYRRSVYGSHVIYYKVDKPIIRIIRILGRQDI